MPATAPQRERSQSGREGSQGTPNRRRSLGTPVLSSRKLGQKRTPSRRRPLSSDTLASSRRSLSRSRQRSVSKTPPHRNGHQAHNYEPSEASESDLVSVTSGPPSTRNEGRQPAKSVQSDRSFRDDSLARKTSSSKGSRFAGEKVVAIQNTVEDLKKHLNDGKRYVKLSQACIEFDHWDDARHGIELHFGVANVLAVALTLATNDDEMRMVCAALEMVFRASQAQVRVAYDAIQVSIVPLLLEVMSSCDQGKLQLADEIMLDITNLLFYWSRIPELRISLARHPGMIDMLIRVATITDQHSKAARMRLISNLAHIDENKILFVQTKGFLDSVLRTAVIETSEKAKEYASTTLMDLAACSDNQILMANNDRVLATMVKLAVTESLPETRETAISGIQSLAFCHSVRLRLVSFSGGVVLDSMRKALSNDTNDKARRKAAGALTNMACDETAELMGNHSGLLETLAVVATKDENSDVQKRAAMALTKIALGITSTMSCYATLMDALVVASLSSAAPSVSQVLRAKARDPENRTSMVRHAGILETLSDICVSSDYMIKDRENAMRALMHLTNEDSNRTIMCQKAVLDALILGASTEGPKWSAFSESAVVAMERLATEPKNRPLMARYPGMLVAIAKVTEREQMLEETGMEATHERLAKPLLMSLLLAM